MNIFTQLFFSLFSPKEISLFRFQGIGKTILYVFILTLLSIIPTFYYYSTTVTDGLNTIDKTLGNKIPSFTIKDGILHTDNNKPVTITNNNFTFLFDGSGIIEERDLANTDHSIALLKDKVLFMAGNKVQSYPYTLFNSLTITKEDVLHFTQSLHSILGILFFVLFLFIYIFSCGMKFIEITLLALIGLFFRNILKKEVEYRHLWRLAAYSVTLPTIFFLVMATLKTPIPNGFFLYWSVSLFVLFLSIKEIPKNISIKTQH